MKTLTLTLVLALAGLAAPSAAGSSADEDLAVVKKATASDNGRAVAAEAAPRSRADEPEWFRVRIVEKGKKKATVKVNLPLALVHALGDDVPVPGCGGGDRHLTIGEVLRSLDTGESLVEIEDDDATIRVWVE
ncbi:MAG: hypothetical protein PVJ73_02320 [Acidobacteriota bacterium]|jgi:hypothetical protein